MNALTRIELNLESSDAQLLHVIATTTCRRTTTASIQVSEHRRSRI